MKKMLLLLVIVITVFIATHRQQLFLRDPMASVLIDGAAESGSQVFINYSNEVLIVHDREPAHGLLVQHNQHVGAPQQVKCLYSMACLTDADVATLATPTRARVGEMSGRLVSLRDDSGRDVRVSLR